jgi:hypothetical protein
MVPVSVSYSGDCVWEDNSTTGRPNFAGGFVSPRTYLPLALRNYP